MQDLLQLTLETDRLLLIPISPLHREIIFKEFTEEITHYMRPVPPKTIAVTDAFIASSRKNMEEGTEIICAITEKKTGEFLGAGGFHRINTTTPEFGIWLKKSAHGHAYGREAMHALKKWADEQLTYDYIEYPVAEENSASRKIPESLGGVIVREYNEGNGAGEVMAWVEYRITK